MTIFDNLKLCKLINKIKNAKRNLEEKYEELQIKYTNLLEEKSEKFDLYIYYQNQYEKELKERKELKKALAVANEKLATADDQIEKLECDIEKLKSKNKTKKVSKDVEKKRNN